MDCLYVRCSVKSDSGIEELIDTVISRCLDLDNQVSISGSAHPTVTSAGKESIFTLGGSDGLTSGDVKNINPMKLRIKKRN